MSALIRFLDRSTYRSPAVKVNDFARDGSSANQPRRSGSESSVEGGQPCPGRGRRRIYRLAHRRLPSSASAWYSGHTTEPDSFTSMTCAARRAPLRLGSVPSMDPRLARSRPEPERPYAAGRVGVPH